MGRDGPPVDLSDVIGPFTSLFDPDALRYATLLDAATGQRAIYALPMAFATYNVHVWRNLLEQAGFTLADVPSSGRHSVLLVRSSDRRCVKPPAATTFGASDCQCRPRRMTHNGFEQFMGAYQANYVTREGELIIDDPEIRRRLIRTMDSYTELYRKGCTPPGAVGWDNRGNNQAFLAQTVAMTANITLTPSRTR